MILRNIGASDSPRAPSDVGRAIGSTHGVHRRGTEAAWQIVFDVVIVVGELRDLPDLERRRAEISWPT